MQILKRYLPEILLTCFIIAYSIYFSLISINRYEKLYAHYFDLGIMHQTVYNTYKGIQTGNFSRILEMTNPHISADQVKRMSVHNDVILGFLAPFYFIYEGPETILVIQTIVLAVGAVFIFLLAKKILKDIPLYQWLALILALSYLMYPPLQKANKFDFHGVTLATTFLLGMFYYWTEKKYKTSILYAILALFTKEQVGMTVAFFGGYVLYEQYIQKHFKPQTIIQTVTQFIKRLFHKEETSHEKSFAYWIIGISIGWILLSMLVIIPSSRGKEHFASQYYDHIKENPLQIFTYPFRPSTFKYATDMLGPTGFLSFLSPIQLLMATPELGINLLSANSNMRNTYFHYSAVITPFVFISTIYGVLVLYQFVHKRNKKLSTKTISIGIGIYILLVSLYGAYKSGPLPFAREPDIIPWQEPQQKYYEVIAWKKILDDDQIKVSTTGVLAPHFTSRQYFYDFSWKYRYADYIVLDTHDVKYGFLKDRSVPAYNDLQKDKNYIRIYEEKGIEVYRKIQL